MVLLICVGIAVPMIALRPTTEPAKMAMPRAQPVPAHEVLALVRENALFDVSDLPQMFSVSALKGYLARKDKYADFLTAEEYVSWRGSAPGVQGSVGMEIERQADGDVVCFPYPNSPAARAGIRKGYRLLAIEGVATDGRALPSLAAVARGPVNTFALLEVAGPDGRSKRLRVRREYISEPRARVRSYPGLDVVEIPSFTAGTRFELSSLLSGWKSGRPVVIDLRGNAGGDFYAAVDSAMLFVPEGEIVASLRTRNGAKEYRSTLVGPRPQQRIILWQDEATASAAELFIAALTENGRAISVGRKSFGKGTRQDVIELGDGAALILTTAYLLTPRGIQFDSVGLLPTEELAPGAGTAAYLAGTARSTGSTRSQPARLRPSHKPQSSRGLGVAATGTMASSGEGI